METENSIEREAYKSHLVELLKSHNIDYGKWGTGTTKTLDHLVDEVIKGETVLVENEQGELVRKLAVLWIEVTHHVADGRVYKLKETHQIFKDGRERRRNLKTSIAEKLVGGEEADDLSVKRALFEELGIESTEIITKLDEDHTVSDSYSFPGLAMEKHDYYYQAEVSDKWLKPEGYIERQKDKDTYFIWVEVV